MPEPAIEVSVIADLDGLEPEVAANLRLRPLGFLYGSAANTAVARGEALPLAGGRIAFTRVEVLARRRNRAIAVLTGLNSLRLWSGKQGEALRDRVDIQLARLSEQRQSWAGLKLDRPLLMGIINVTPDSLYASAGSAPEQAIARGRAMLDAGADIIDVGGESTRPGAKPVPPEEEARRIEPVLRALAAAGATVSVDTRHAPVMAAALSWGAKIINDVSALTGDGSLETVARAGASVVLMHMRGEPASMQSDPDYVLPSLDIADYLAQRITVCTEAGVPPHRIVVDPGLGFGKTVAHNLEILGRLGLFHGFGCGVLIGASRKSTIGRLDRAAPVEARLPGSLAAALQALDQGIQILRVHDVAETRQAVAVWQAIAAGA